VLGRPATPRDQRFCSDTSDVCPPKYFRGVRLHLTLSHASTPKLPSKAASAPLACSAESRSTEVQGVPLLSSWPPSFRQRCCGVARQSIFSRREFWRAAVGWAHAAVLSRPRLGAPPPPPLPPVGTSQYLLSARGDTSEATCPRRNFFRRPYLLGSALTLQQCSRFARPAAREVVTRILMHECRRRAP
jgi:hypothetical protein